MTIAVTGATGNLGHLALDALVEGGAAPSELVAVVRDPAKAKDLSARGVDVRRADYNDRAALKAAFAGVDKLLLVSSSEVGQREAQHANVIDAAAEAGVSFIAYTSVLRADSSPLGLSVEHTATEKKLAESGIDHALLRNGWYWENYLGSVPTAVETGKLFGSAGNGRVAGATRKDYAVAAATVLLADDQAGKVYELGGDKRLTYPELAAVIGENAGKAVEYVDLPPTEYAGVLEGAGLPSAVANMLADSDAGIAAGALDTETGDLQKLIGRESTPFADVLAR